MRLVQVGPLLLEAFLARRQMKHDMAELEVELMKKYEVKDILDISRVMSSIR